MTKHQPLFTFAIVSDTHIKPHEGDLSSPFPTNLLANARNRYVVQMLNSLSPDFVIHLGDHTQPVPALPTHGKAAQAVRDIYADLGCDMFFVPGNHDIGDKPVDWMPAHKCSEEWIAEFEHYFGPAYSSFDKDGVHFVLVNSSVFNSGLPSESKQREWLEQDLAANEGKRTFMFMHYPPFLTKPDEDTHYENLDEPARSWLLALIEKYSVEAVYAGHVHGFFYNQYAAAECYVAPSVTFIRNDFSELFRVPPGKEHGRNDLGKFGIFFVKVYEDGHITQFLHTDGATLEPGEAFTDGPRVVALRDAALHPKYGAPSPIGVDMRHPWAEIVEMPFNGPVDEFNRKRVRNDYPLLALWDCGLRRLRVPASDLLDPNTRTRMAELHGIGHQFTVFSFGQPSPKLKSALLEYANLVDVWEIIAPWEQFAGLAGEIKEIKEQAGLKTQIAKVASSAHGEIEDSRFDMFVFHGFHTSEEELLQAFLEDGGREVADQFVFQVPAGVDPWTEMTAIDKMAAKLGIKAAVMVQLAPENEAWAMWDDQAQANRVASAVLAALLAENMELSFDTFDDIDRGYFVRNGLVDRRFNLRPAGHVLRSLHGLYRNRLEGVNAVSAVENGGVRMLTLSKEEGSVVLVLPAEGAEGAQRVAMLPVGDALPTSGTGEVIDLVTETAQPVEWRLDADDNQIKLQKAVELNGPTLICL